MVLVRILFFSCCCFCCCFVAVADAVVVHLPKRLSKMHSMMFALYFCVIYPGKNLCEQRVRRYAEVLFPSHHVIPCQIPYPNVTVFQR